MNGPKYLILPCWIFLILFNCVHSSGQLHAQEDSVFAVKSIFIVGAKKTKEWVIFREMTFAQGDSIKFQNLEKEIKRSEQNIYNLELFNEVKINSRIIDKEIHFIISVKERWFIFGAPSLGVEERNSYDLIEAIKRKDFHRLVYGVAVQWRNVTGRNETITFDGQLGFSKRLNIDFFRPALFRKANIDGRIGIRVINEKEIIIGTEEGIPKWERVESEPFQKSFEGYLGFRKRFSLYQSLYTELNYKTLRFSDSLYTFNLYDESARYISQEDGHEYYPSLLMTFADDRRDLRSFPLRGYKYQVLFRYTGVPGLSTTQFAKLGATWAHHIPINERWNFAYGSSNILTFGDSIPFFEKNTIGINRTDFGGLSTDLRGYEPYAISGTYVNMNKAELKFALIPRQIIHLPYIPNPKFQDVPVGLYLTGFVDTGYISDNSFNNQDQFLRNTFLTGYGLGLNMIGFYDILIRLEYSRNHLNQGGFYFHATVPIK